MQPHSNSASLHQRGSLAAKLAVVPANLDRDEDSIIGVWQRNLSPRPLDTHRQKFDWYYRRCPFGPARCWLLVTGGDRVVGTAGVGLRRIRSDRSTPLFGHSSDFAVDQDHRVFLPALKLGNGMLSSLRNDLKTLYTLPNQLSIGLLRRMGFHTPWQLKRYVKVLRVERYLPQSFLLPRPMRRGLAAAIDFCQRAVSLDNWRRGRGLRIEEFSEFDARFDDLWARNSPRFPMIGQRTANYLDWRYRQCPLQKYYTLGLLSASGDSLMGYAVSYLDWDLRLRIVDFLTNQGPVVAEELIAGLLSWARRQKATSVSCEFFGAEQWEQGLRRFGFVLREPEKTLTVHPCQGWDTGHFQGWYFTLGDEDYN